MEYHAPEIELEENDTLSFECDSQLRIFKDYDYYNTDIKDNFFQDFNYKRKKNSN